MVARRMCRASTGAFHTALSLLCAWDDLTEQALRVDSIDSSNEAALSSNRCSLAREGRDEVSKKCGEFVNKL